MSWGPGRLVEMSRFFVCLLEIFVCWPRKIRKNTVAGVNFFLFFFFLENTLKLTQNYDCLGSLSEKYGNPTSAGYGEFTSCVGR